MIAGALDGLNDEEGFDALGAGNAMAVAEMAIEDFAANSVQFAVLLKNGETALDVAVEKSLVGMVEHLLERFEHVGDGEFIVVSKAVQSRAFSDPEQKVADAFQIGNETDGGEQFTRGLLAHADHRFGDGIVDFAFHGVELTLTLLEGDAGDARRGGHEIAQVESGVFGDETGARGKRYGIFAGAVMRVGL